jgi:hypothetical protein
MKSLNYEQEINYSLKSLKHLGFEIESAFEDKLPSNNDKHGII